MHSLPHRHPSSTEPPFNSSSLHYYTTIYLSSLIDVPTSFPFPIFSQPRSLRVPASSAKDTSENIIAIFNTYRAHKIVKPPKIGFYFSRVDYNHAKIQKDQTYESFWSGIHLTTQDDFHTSKPPPLLQNQRHPHLRLLPTFIHLPCIPLARIQPAAKEECHLPLFQVTLVR